MFVDICLSGNKKTARLSNVAKIKYAIANPYDAPVMLSFCTDINIIAAPMKAEITDMDAVALF